MSEAIDNLTNKTEDLEVQARNVVAASNRRMERHTIEFRFLAGLIIVALASVLGVTWLEYNQDRKAEKILTVLEDATAPGGEVYERGQEGQAAAVQAIVDAVIAGTDAQLEELETRLEEAGVIAPE